MVRIRIGDEEHALDWDEWEARVRQGRVPPDALVAIEAITDGAFVPARTLESYQSLRDDAALAWQGRFVAGPAPLMTALIVGVNIRLWWFAKVPEAYVWLDVNLTNWAAPIFEDGEPWRLLSMGLLHVAFPHLAMNMLWLAYTGWNLERALGRVNLLVIYLASVLGGSVLSALFSPESRSLGASGGVFGLVAAAVVFGFARPELLPSRGRRVFGLALLPYLVVMFASGLSNTGIDNWSHFGGLVTGAFAALVLDPTPLQRWRGWNALVWSTAGLGAAALFTALVVAGPRLEPIEDVEAAAERIRTNTVVLTPTAGELAPYRPVLWAVPAGWRYGVTASGDAGFTSPSPRGGRTFAVREDEHPAPVEPFGRALAWSDKVRTAMPDAEIGRPQAVQLAGRTGLGLKVRTPRGDLLQWWCATRGVYALEAVWQVDARQAQRLEPLARRLIARVAWKEPEAMVQARAALERNPDSHRAKADLARALAAVGEPFEAHALYQTLIAQEPRNADHIAGLLQLAAWYPAAVPDLDALRDRALAADPSPAALLAVVDSLEASQEHDAARGLLALAWERLPGDRVLRRALGRRAIPTALDPDSNLPRTLRFDPDTGRPRDAATIDALRQAPLTVDAAREAGARATARRARWVTQVLAALPGDPTAAVDPLLRLKLEAPPADRDAALAELIEDLRTLERRGSLRWLPGELAEPIRGAGLLAALGGDPVD